MDISYYKKYEPIFGSWRIVEEIGEGSYGQVFEIERSEFGQRYTAALKVISIPQSQSEIESVRDDGLDNESVAAYYRDFVGEIADELSIMAELKGDSNVVSYEDHKIYQHDDGIGWDVLIRMELLTPLTRYVMENPLARKDVVQIGCDICRALELCQKHNIIHRDIKPENIFVSDNGNYKLGDFGVAKTMEKANSGLSKKGTYTYMAPEVYKGLQYDARADIYSLGIVLYKLLNDNRAPFMPDFPITLTHGCREAALEKRIGGAQLPLPKHAEGMLADIIMKACSYDPEKRYQTPRQMRNALEGIIFAQSDEPIILPRGDELKTKTTGTAANTERTEKTLKPDVNNFSETTSGSPQNWKNMPPESENTDETEMLFPDEETAANDQQSQQTPKVSEKKTAPVADTAAIKKKNNILMACLAVLVAAVVIVTVITLLPKKEETASIDTIAATAQPTQEPAEEETIAVTKLKLPQAVILRIGDSADAALTVEPADADTAGLTWSSDNEKALTVENGTMKGVAEGKALLTVSSGDVSAKCTAFVIHDKTGNVSTQTVRVGAWFYTVNSGNLFYIGNKVYWLDNAVKADNSQIYTLGQMASKQLGKCAASTAQAKPWIEYFSDSAKTKSLGQLAIAVGPDNKKYVVMHKGASSANPTAVTVTEYKEIKAPEGTGKTGYTSSKPDSSGVKSVSISRSYYDGNSVGVGFQLSASINPSNAKVKSVTWRSSNSSVATVSSSGYVSIVGGGRAEIYAIAGSHTATCVVYITLPN